MPEYEMIRDSTGYPVMVEMPRVREERLMFAATVRDPDTRSGNPNHDIATGRFGEGSNAKKKEASAPSDAPTSVRDPSLDKRLDAVRDAARENDSLDVGDLKEFLAGRTNRQPTDAELAELLAEVKSARLDDLLDVLDNQLRGRVENMKRSRRTVRVQAPKGWVKRVFNGLDDDEVRSLVGRLEAKGWDQDDLKKHVIGRVRDEGRREAFEQEYGS